MTAADSRGIHHHKQLKAWISLLHSPFFSSGINITNSDSTKGPAIATASFSPHSSVQLVAYRNGTCAISSSYVHTLVKHYAHSEWRGVAVHSEGRQTDSQAELGTDLTDCLPQLCHRLRIIRWGSRVSAPRRGTRASRGLSGCARGREVALLALCGGLLSFGMSTTTHETSFGSVKGATL